MEQEYFYSTLFQKNLGWHTRVDEIWHDRINWKLGDLKSWSLSIGSQLSSKGSIASSRKPDAWLRSSSWSNTILRALRMARRFLREAVPGPVMTPRYWLKAGLETGKRVKHTWPSKRKCAFFWDIMPGFTLPSPDQGICMDIIDCQLVIYMGSLPLTPPSPTSDYKHIFLNVYENVLKGEKNTLNN